MNALNKEILRLALPSILANITVPIVGMVDIAVAGHLHGSELFTAAAFIGGTTRLQYFNRVKSKTRSRVVHVFGFM